MKSEFVQFGNEIVNLSLVKGVTRYSGGNVDVDLQDGTTRRFHAGEAEKVWSFFQGRAFTVIWPPLNDADIDREFEGEEAERIKAKYGSGADEIPWEVK